MAFKDKTKNRNTFNENKTIDALHNEIITTFSNKRKNLSNYKHNLDLIERKLISLNVELRKDPNILNTKKLQKNIWRIEDERERLKKEIENIETNQEEQDYLLETGILLNQYYKIKDGKDITNNKKNPRTKEKKKKDVLSWFENTEENNKLYNLETGDYIITKHLSNTTKKTHNNNNTKINDVKNLNSVGENIKKGVGNNKKLIKNNYELLTKKQLYTKYMEKINPNYCEDSTLYYNSDICEHCDTEMLLNANNGIMICSSCGIQEPVILDSEKPSYKEPPKEMTSFCYKRINHLNEFLAQFQAKETTEIPDDIYNEILVEIKKERVKNMAKITPEKMRTILRKIKRNDYYEHIPYIINQLNGLPPPIISSEVEEIIRNMFREIQEPFETLREKLFPTRKNFLSYNYVMYKFFELLELDEYLTCFQLLKSRNKLHQQDIIWKHICAHLNWQFISSI